MTTESTYLTMTVEHLGADATQADLDTFRNACRNYIAQFGATPEEATEYVWALIRDWTQIEALAGSTGGS